MDNISHFSCLINVNVRVLFSYVDQFIDSVLCYFTSYTCLYTCICHPSIYGATLYTCISLCVVI